MAGKVSVKDNGLSRVVANLSRGKGGRVRVGVLHDAPKKGDDTGRATLLEVAAYNEFGAPAANVPQRSFIRATVDAKKPEIQAAQGRVAKQVLAGKITFHQGLEQIGAKVVGLMKQRIAAGIPPENAESTIARKGSSKPLINFGQLRGAITYEVVQGK